MKPGFKPAHKHRPLLFIAGLFLPFGQLVPQNEHGRAFFLPAPKQCFWRSKWGFLNATENNVRIAITVQIARVHC